MPSLEDSRRWFLERVRSYSHPTEREHFAAVLDDFIAWSEARAPHVSFVHDKQYEQKVVSFREHGGNYILWSAYPRLDGAKLEILPGAPDGIAADTRERAIRLLRKLSSEPISDETTLRVPFRALKSPDRRAKVKVLLDEIVTELSDASSQRTR